MNIGNDDNCMFRIIIYIKENQTRLHEPMTYLMYVKINLEIQNNQRRTSHNGFGGCSRIKKREVFGGISTLQIVEEGKNLI